MLKITVREHSKHFSWDYFAKRSLALHCAPPYVQRNIFNKPTNYDDQFFRYVRRLSGCVAMETGLPAATTEYLRTRIKSLSQRERVSSIILDEVYSAKRIEYVNGQFYGLENSDITKTLLCFMVKSLSNKYEDIVAMVPLASISSQVIKSWWDRVLQVLTEIGYDIVATLTDAHSSNRRFFTQDLCGGKLGTSVPNPCAPGSKIFLIFDSVHLFKNVYNNFLNRREFVCPPFEGSALSAKFKHVEDLYRMELSRAVKYAHKLTDKVIAPQPIERTKVQLADRFFDDSTINGLEQCGTDESGWKETARFLKLIWRFWNCVNVQSRYAATHLRDERRKPITKIDKDQITFLSAFYRWMEEWEKMSKKSGGLSRETFLSGKQTCLALKELAEYLLKEKEFEYVLLGKVNSDPLERRFGWYRQLAGANYFISVRQFLEAEKKYFRMLTKMPRARQTQTLAFFCLHFSQTLSSAISDSMVRKVLSTTLLATLLAVFSRECAVNHAHVCLQKAWSRPMCKCKMKKITDKMNKRRRPETSSSTLSTAEGL
jgi:hypothetical protein